MRISIPVLRNRRSGRFGRGLRHQVTASEPSPVRYWAVGGEDGATYKWWIGGIVILSTIIAVMSFEAMSLALPTMMVSMRVGLQEMSWTFTGYLISRTLCVGMAGWLGNRLGNRNLFALSLAVFTGGALLCGLAWSFEALVLFRMLQGMGAGPLVPLIMVVLHETFPPQQRGLAQSLYMVGDAAGSIMGRGLAGYLIETLGWRFVFYLHVPLGIIAFIALLAVVPNRRETQVQDVDGLGLCLLAAFVVCLLVGLQSGAQDGWGHDRVLTLLPLAGVSLLAFIVNEHLVPAPLIDLKLFRQRAYSLICLVSSCNIIGLMGAFFLTPLMLQRLLDLTPLQAGLILVPGAIAWGVCGPIGGKLSDWIDSRWVLAVGFGTTIWMLIQLSSVTLYTPSSTLSWRLTGLFSAMALSFTPIIVVGMRTVPVASLRMGMGMLNLIRGLASVVGIAGLSILLEHRQRVHMQRLAEVQSQHGLEVEPLLMRLRNVFHTLGDGSEMAAYKAMAVLNERLYTDAELQAYRECFIALACLYAVLFIPVLMLHQRYTMSANRNAAEG